jgi:hypothetical protein
VVRPADWRPGYHQPLTRDANISNTSPLPNPASGNRPIAHAVLIGHNYLMKTSISPRVNRRPAAPTTHLKRTPHEARPSRDEVAKAAYFNKGSIAPDESAYTLNITGVYQDSVTRDWAMQTCRQAAQLAAVECVQNKLYNAHSLRDPKILLEAVRATLRADVIVVSVYAAEELPLDLYVWFDAWLPRRRSRVGVLAALIGVAEPRGSQSIRTHEYLQAVARRGELDFMPQECKPPVASRTSSII